MINLSQTKENLCSNNKRTKILFIIPSLGGGGAERTLLNVLRYLNRDKFIPELVLFEKKGIYLDYLPKGLRIFDLKKKNCLNFFKGVIGLSNILKLERPDIVSSFGKSANLIIMVVKFFGSFKCKFCLSERSYTITALRESSFSKIRIILAKWFLKKADSIIAVSGGVKNTLVEDFLVPDNKIKVIYNPTDLIKISKLANEAVINPWFKDNIPIIITVGRLIKSKGYGYLLRAFKTVRERQSARLVFIGEGQDRELLQALAEDLGIANDVYFLGFQENPFKYLKKASLFVLSSLYEGFPNALVEAMASGVPVISTRCPSGPDEIITDGVNGLLVPVAETDALAQGVLRLLNDRELRERLAEAGKARAKDFAVEKMVAEYEGAFDHLCQENTAPAQAFC